MKMRPYPTKPALVKECKHPKLSKNDARATPWFNTEDENYFALFKIVTATSFSNALRKCAKFLYTGKLESFHSMKLLYLPKLHSFEMQTMIVLTMLAATQNNLLKTYVCRAYSRANKAYVLKIEICDNLTFKKAILWNIEENLRNHILLPFDLQNSSYINKDIPKTFHGLKTPDKNMMIEQRMSRFQNQKVIIVQITFHYHFYFIIVTCTTCILFTYLRNFCIILSKQFVLWLIGKI